MSFDWEGPLKYGDGPVTQETQDSHHNYFSKSGIYLITETQVKEVVRYVGKTTNPITQRIKEHFSKTEPNSYLRKLMQERRSSVRVRYLSIESEPDLGNAEFTCYQNYNNQIQLYNENVPLGTRIVGFNFPELSNLSQ